LKAIVNDFGFYGKSEREFIIPQVKYFTNDSWEVVSAGRPLNGGVSGYPVLLRNKYSKGTLFVLTIPDDFGNLYDYPEGALNMIRKYFSRDLGYYIECKSKVSLFPYDNKTFVVENFNDEPVEVNIVFNNKVAAMKNLENNNSMKPAEGIVYGNNRWSQYKEGQTVFKTTLPAHSYKAFGY
jgi:hypothetical protein